MDEFSYVGNAHSDYIDQMYEAYKENPENVDASWAHFFEGFDFAKKTYDEDGLLEGTGVSAGDGGIYSSKEIAVRNLIYSYRTRAHLKSTTNPVRERRDRKALLELSDFGLTDDDLNKQFISGKEIGLENATLQKIIDKLKTVYSGAIGFEYMYIREPERQQWLKERYENEFVNYNPDIGVKKEILSKLNEAVVFENFLHTKYIGQKRFSLEGGENLIPALNRIIYTASKNGAAEAIIGMAHRGRLNVLANIMGKTYEEIFSEFEGNVQPDLTMGDGDVKYHMGYTGRMQTPHGEMYLKLSPNPSHLEAVDPVVLGMCRAQIDDEFNEDYKKVLPILIHGDAAVAGQGIVYEITQMSKLKGYHVGGTIHFIINNQVGFTTDFDDARSSIYCTDVAKLVDAPVIHVNGDDAEAVDFAAKVATEYRQKFHGDIFIDMVCYRRHGHNESDEPKFTQPKLYNVIAKHPNPREVYNKALIDRGDVDADLAKKMDKDFRSTLQDRLNEVKQKEMAYKPQKYEEEWQELRRSKPEDFDSSPDTSIDKSIVEKVAKALVTIPEGFKPLKQITRLIKERQSNFFDKKMLNWADGELLAYGSLLLEDKIVRLAGQDSIRGTFSHRHAHLFDAENNTAYCNLDHIEENQPQKLKIYNSLLSEFGALGFELGYSMSCPSGLIIWEAQFGDFVNGAQVIIDQFLSSAETKWQRMNGLVMYLPHGYEGQGPEHSNARPERFLELSAEYNMVVANITKPANLFHMLRRQLAWEFRKPCILMSPKSLLRHPEVVSPIEDFTDSKFHEIYGDDYVDDSKVKKVLLCSGKVFFDLWKKQQQDKRRDVAIIRVEQLHPFPMNQLDEQLKKYKKADVYWVQEEPANMGYWTYILRLYRNKVKEVYARKSSASPATGFAKVHAKEQEDLINRAFE